jgi:predicted DCC family thiol-disulfide oxidoreductase YuxK
MSNGIVLTVFYDDRCGLCSKEIAYYQTIAPEQCFVWRPISKSKRALQQLNLSESEALMSLYSCDESGHLFTGVATFIQIWRRLPRFKWLARLMALPVVYSIACYGYQIFAKRRFARLKHCQIAQSNVDENL